MNGSVAFISGLGMMMAGMILLGNVVFQEMTRAPALHWYSRTGYVACLAMMLLVVGAVLASAG